MAKKKNECFSCTLVEEYDTSNNEEVKDEIDVVVNTYDNVRVSGKSSAHCKVYIPLVSESCPTRRVTLEIRVVPGYPYVAPAIRLSFPLGVHPGDEGTLSEYEVKQMAKEVSDNIQLCLPIGMPCMMQIVSTVSAIVESGIDKPQPQPQRLNGTSQGEQSLISSGQSPSLTPVPLKAREALKLSMLTFHLMKKCCDLKDPESMEEAKSNFDFLIKYLLDTVAVFPEAARAFFPWNGLSFAKAFSSNMDGIVSLPLDQQEVAKWFWEDEGRNFRPQQGSEGRYRNEFIQQRLLGAGGFAPVYVCRKKIDGRLYAIKKVAMTETQSEKVLREVQTLASLNHKNIVRYYDAWVEDGCDEELRNFVDEEAEEEETAEEGEVDGSDNEKPGNATSHRMRTIICASSSDSDSVSSRSSRTSTSSEEESAFDTSSGDDDDDDTNSTCSSATDINSAARARRPDAKKRKSATHYQTLYIQMELCSARSLRHLIEESDSCGSGGIFASANGEKVAVSILRQLLSVTAHTHRERVVHRDLKPDNVLFEMGSSHSGDEAGTIRVADFGLARVMSGVKRVTSVLDVEEMNSLTDAIAANQPTGNCGSVLYCAPEQEKGLEYDFKVDEFSIGMIALEMWLAIAGKGFRERFTIMNEVWRTGKLPSWFVSWNPNMSNIIELLLQPDPRLRMTCEAVLSTAELPGDPVDIVSALETVDRYGERIAGRMIQKIVRSGAEFRKPSIVVRDDTRFLGSTTCTDLVQAVNVVGMLHGAVPVAVFDHIVPMNPKLVDMNVDCIVDSSGRSFAYAKLPHFAVASFLGMQENAAIGSFYQFYHRTQPYVSFTTPLLRHDVVNELTFEPLLSLCHLLSLMDLAEPIEVIVSHAQWLQTVFPTEVGTRPPPAKLSKLQSRIQTTDQVGQAISHITENLFTAGLVASDERDEFIRKYTTALLDILNLFEMHMNVHLQLYLDPALHPSDALVAQKALETGILFECRYAHDAVPLAFGCALDNFTAKCAVANPDISAFNVVVHVRNLLTVSKHVQMPWRENLVLDGVAAKRHDLYAQTLMPYMIEAAMQLWKGNIRACIRRDTDAHALMRALKQKRIRWLLVDGKRIVSASTNQQSKSTGRSADIALDELRQAVRDLSASERAAPPSDTKVKFLVMKEDSFTENKAVAVYDAMTTSLPKCVVIVDAGSDTIQRCIDQFNEFASDASADTFAVPALAQWLKANATTSPVAPIFSVPDGRIVYFINYKRFKVSLVNKKDKQRKKK
ncbi:protein kinase [Leptomonas pyrrhocoris]|uniref:Protein kinase n=1 Tax=Leptomonas pyrrhocoris TaxID=157538 RepID=A0A0N0DT23_LEPPY|nr:protein kinase [Leptomonas pyrrhocoris]KPA76888.1 protein kinase [Leptomonas pyrrhocoris]|eukprot:XP_015655327.1 protein kinase [Leptomonas pyrrhocoris]